MMNSRTTKIVCLLLAIITVFSLIAPIASVSAASTPAKVSGVKASNKVTYLGKSGSWKIYSHSASLKWNRVSGADYYQVRYRNGSWTQITKTVYGTSFNFPGYTCHGFGANLSMPYYYNIQVRAVDVNGRTTTYGPWSNIILAAWC